MAPEPSWGLEAGASVLVSPGGVGPAALAFARLRFAPIRRLELRLAFAGLGTLPRVQGPDGASARVSQLLALSEVALRPWPDLRVRPSFSLDAGALEVSAEGDAPSPYRGRTAARWAALLGGGAGVEVLVGPHLGVATDVRAFAAIPYPTVRFLGEAAARVAVPRAARQHHHGGLAVSGCRGGVARALPGRHYGLLAGLLFAGACTSTPLEVLEIDPATLNDGLVAHWTFDEGSGDVVVDHSGNKRDGQITGGTWLKKGRFGGALHLDEGAFVSVDDFPNATQSWSVSAWVRLTDATASTEVLKTVISTEIEISGGWEMNIDRTMTQPGAHFGYWEGSVVADYYRLTCFCMGFGEWTHLAASVDADSGTLSLYVGGVLRASTPITVPILPGLSTLYIGKWAADGRLLVGDLDDILIYRQLHAVHGQVDARRAAPGRRPRRHPHLPARVVPGGDRRAVSIVSAQRPVS